MHVSKNILLVLFPAANIKYDEIHAYMQFILL